MIRQASNLLHIATSAFLSLGESSQSWRTSRCPRAASRQTQRGPSEPAAKTSPLLPFGVGWIAANSTFELAMSSLKKPRNSRVLKMVCTEVFSPCALDSRHTLYCTVRTEVSLVLPSLLNPCHISICYNPLCEHPCILSLSSSHSVPHLLFIMVFVFPFSGGSVIFPDK